jgi:glycosyltransferase involved in cell wall biosynthesis
VSTHRPSWFELDSRVRSIKVEGWRDGIITDVDAVVATTWQTAEVMGRPEFGRGFYFIQGYEDWNSEPDRLHATWRLPISKLAVATWLVEKAAELDAGTVRLVPNGVDDERFGIDIAPSDRHDATVAMLWSRAPVKGSAAGMEALRQVHEVVPHLAVTLFSTNRPPLSLPPWVRFVKGANDEQLRDLYNTNAVFLQPSKVEGWGLTTTEAMSCGAALVTTDCGGSREYAIDGETALMVPVGDSARMAAGILRLLQDREERERIAAAGAKLIASRFTWEQAVDAMEFVLST